MTGFSDTLDSSARRALSSLRAIAARTATRSARTARRIRFHLLFPRYPAAEGPCNSKLIVNIREPRPGRPPRRFLVFMRIGTGSLLLRDSGPRNFDLALNFYMAPEPQADHDCEYLCAGGINKFKAARQFITAEILERYDGFMFLDDDLAISQSRLGAFLDQCAEERLALAQPSLSADSSHSYASLLNHGPSGTRAVGLVEVMCPYFSRDALRRAIHSFDLSDSTWGLDFLWPALLGVTPVVLDAHVIRHARPVMSGAFYPYMRSIGVSAAADRRRLIKRRDRIVAAQRVPSA